MECQMRVFKKDYVPDNPVVVYQSEKIPYN